jgi:PadR family transcriptional regulator PadR
MEKSTIKTNMKKATVELLLLKLLSEGDKYGYQLTQEMKLRSNANYTLLEGSMYPILYRLEEQNMISSEKKLVGKRMTRVYYHLETKGKEYYETILKEFKDYVTLLDFLLNSKEGDKYEGV